jgi:predicted dienelactone hydrolase
VKLSIDYPTRGGPHPLIVFSHGGGGSNRGYPGLAAHWASYGYVIIRPQHVEPTQPEDMTVADWRSRVGDISFVIDSVNTLVERFPELQGKIDVNRIAAAGHSRGAMTAMLSGGLRTFPGPNSFADPRVKAVAALSPPGPREMWGVTTESFAEIRVPLLVMTGSRDTGATESETPEWRMQAFELAPAGDKWLVNIEGVNHNTFTGQAGPLPGPAPSADRVPSPRDPLDPTAPRPSRPTPERPAAGTVNVNQRALFGTIRSLALAFFDTYLKEDTKGRQHLEEADARGNVEVRKK